MRRTMASAVLATIAVAAAALAPQAAAAPAKGAALGISDNAYHAGTPDAFWFDIETLKPRIFRVNIAWNSIAKTQPAAPKNPADPAYQWGHLDDLVRGLGQRSVPVLITVYGTPNWASLYGTANCKNPPSWGLYCQARAPRPLALGQFMTAVGLRYSGTFTPAGATTPLPRVRLWEIWNESNNKNFLIDKNKRPSKASVAIYAKMLSASAKALRAVAKPRGYSQVVIGGAVGGRLGGLKHADLFKALATSPACRANSGKGCFDALSIHAYNAKPKQGLNDKPGKGFFSVGNFDQFTKLVKTLWPKRKIPLYVTEFGWQTNPPDTSVVGVTLAQQAKFLNDTVVRFRTKYPQVKSLIWWLMEDDADIANWQSGLRFLNGPTKPSYATFRALAGG